MRPARSRATSGRWASGPRLILWAPAAVVVTALILWTGAVERSVRIPVQVTAPLPYSAYATAVSSTLPTVAALATVPQPFTITRGQTLSGLLTDFGMPAGELQPALAALSEAVDPRRIQVGETGLAYVDPSSGLTGLRLRLSNRGWLELARDRGTWESSLKEFRRELRLARAVGELEGSLEEAVLAAGGAGAVTYEMASVLEWDLDFTRDLRRGDRFEVLYEEVWLDGRRASVDQVLALVYENRGRRLEAYLFDDGYYDADGRPLQKMFLRSPLRFSRVTSRFSNRRFHPILRVHRPHYGVDYGAARGTPVRATANGVVVSAGRSGGAGNMVKIRHPNGYVTAYLHLQGFAPGVRKGKRVRQKDVIGYVGSTGLSTAPHLDYRVQKNGRWIDPLSMDSVPSEPAPQHELERFLTRRDALRRALAGAELEATQEPPVLVAGKRPPTEHETTNTR